MRYRIILKIQDSKPKVNVVHDYCIPIINRMIDQVTSKAENQRGPGYSNDIKKILKMCAPDEIELREYLDDIIKYYERYFTTNKTDDELEITVEAVFHKCDKESLAYTRGNTITIPFFGIIKDLIQFNSRRINDNKKDTKEYQIVKEWKNNTKLIFTNQLRYVMAHEVYHVLHEVELKKAGISSNNKLDIVSEIFAEYFALAYINDFCNATGAKYCNTADGALDLRERAYFTEEDKKNGTISRQLIYSASMFDRRSGDNRELCDADYNGGAFLLALAIENKCDSFGTGDKFFAEIYAMVMENKAGDALEEIISRKGKLLKWINSI